MTMTIMAFDAADEIFEEVLSNAFQGGYETVLVVDGDLHLDGDFLPALAKLAPDGDYELVAIKGDLTVSGRIASYDYHPGLYVSGYTRGQTLEGGDCEIYINDATIECLVYGYYNDGILEAGNVDVPYVINSNHDLRINAEAAIMIDNYGDDDAYDFGSNNIVESFVDEVLVDDDECVDIDAIYQRVLAGLPILREGAMTAAQAALAKVARAAEARQTSLDLRAHKLKSFPPQICEMTWLQRLDLGDNAIGKLPAEIGKLVDLEELYVDGCGLGSLPAEIGQLEKLRVLSVGKNSVYDFEQTPYTVPLALPASLGELVNLEELDLSGLSFSCERKEGQRLADMTEYPLPASMAKLVKLRRLTAHGTNLRFPEAMHGMVSLEELSLRGSSYAYLKEVPEALTTFKKLRHLDLGGNFFREIPQSLVELDQLEELVLSGSLGCLEAPLPDLSPLTNLRILRLNGSSEHSGVKEPPHEILAPLFSMTLPALVELSIDRWGEKKNLRPHLPPGLIAEIGRFSALEKIDLSFNGLTSMPESFYALAKLETIDLRYNGLHKAERQRIATSFPETKIDFRNQRFEDGDDEQGEVRQLSELVKQANGLRDKGNFADALAAYDKALAQIAEGAADSPYNQLYCLYGKAWVCSQLAYVRSDVAESDKMRNRELGFSMSEKALALVPEVIWHFTDEGQFDREVLRFCGNFVAWELQVGASGPDDPALTRALEVIERAVTCMDGSQHHFLLDTKVRVLLKMQRNEDAYRAAQTALRVNPDFADLADIKADPGYQRWLEGSTIN